MTKTSFIVTLLKSVLEEAFPQRPIPETMDVAIGINPFHLAFLAFEFYLRSLARLKDLETEAMLHFKSNHNDVMLLGTRMFNRPDFHP